MKNVIVIPSHRSGLKFLEDFLCSFKGYNKYPILIVINDFKKEDMEQFNNIVGKFKGLPIKIETLESNSFEFGGLYAAYKNTDYDNFFLIPHSCEIVNTELFDILFEKYKDKSVAFSIMDSIYGKGFWQGHIGKYRRKILDMIDMDYYLPHDMAEAIKKSEVWFTIKYSSLEKDFIVLFPDLKDSYIFEERFGRLRKKIANEYIIKWKTHWNVGMVKEALKKLGISTEGI